MASFNRIHKTDLIAFMAGAVVLLMLMHSEIIEGAIQGTILQKDGSRYKNEEKSISGLSWDLTLNCYSAYKIQQVILDRTALSSRTGRPRLCLQRHQLHSAHSSLWRWQQTSMKTHTSPGWGGKGWGSTPHRRLKADSLHRETLV